MVREENSVTTRLDRFDELKDALFRHSSHELIDWFTV